MSKKKMSYEDLVEECKRLRLAHEQAEARFFVFLMVVEKDHVDTWGGTFAATFEHFVLSNHLAKWSRYDLFVRGVDRVGTEAALLHGVDWTMQAGKFRDASDGAIAEFTARASAFLETERVQPSEETVREWRNQIDSPGKPHETVRRASEIARLRGENEKLKAELRVARKKIAQLEADILLSGTTKKKKVVTMPAHGAA